MNSNPIEIKEKLFSFIKENTFKETDNLEDSTLIFKEGFFDSMGFALLIDFLNESFGIEAEDEDLVEENFESVNAICNFIQHKENN